MIKKASVVFVLCVAVLSGCFLTETKKSDEAQNHFKAVPLSEEEAKNIAVKVFELNWSLKNGTVPQELEKTKVMIDGMAYYELPSHINTKEKFFAYYANDLTEHAIQQMFESHHIQVRNGKLLKMYGELGTLMDWNHAKATLASETDSHKTFTFEVPTSDDQYEIRNIDFVFDAKKQKWLVNTNPDEML